jgi:hypothetical protein
MNTDREIWRKGDGDGNGMSYYEPSIHVTAQGAIGINVGGNVWVKTVEEWHSLAGRVAVLEDDLTHTIAFLEATNIPGCRAVATQLRDQMGWPKAESEQWWRFRR